MSPKHGCQKSLWSTDLDQFIFWPIQRRHAKETQLLSQENKKTYFLFLFLSQLSLGTRNSFQSSSLNGWRQWGGAKPHPPPRGLITPFRLAPLRPRRGRFQWQNPFIFFFPINRTDGAVRPIKGRPRAPKASTLPRRGRRGRGRGLLNSAGHLIPSFPGRRCGCGEHIRKAAAERLRGTN